MGKKNRVSESSEKAEKLKSLNKMLLKEASESRKQVYSLTQLNVSLESELARLSDNDYVVMSKLEKDIMILFTHEQFNGHFLEQLKLVRTIMLEKNCTFEKFEVFLNEACDNLEKHKALVVKNECEIEKLKEELKGKELDLRRICEERDELKGLFGGCNVVVVKKRVKEDLFELWKKNGVRRKVKDGIFELRTRNREMEREIGELRDALVGEKELMERFECVVRDKDLVEMRCVKLKEDLRRKEEELRVVREMGVIREAKDVEVGKRCELENVVSLREEERRLLVNVAELENKCVEGEEKQKKMGKKMDRLLEERKCKEKSIVGMMDEKITLEKKLHETLTQLGNVKCKLEHVVKQNVGIVEAKNVEVGRRCELETVASELNETMVGLREEEQRLLVNVAKLEDKCVENEEKQRVMQKKVGRLLEERKSNEKSIEGLMDEQIMLEKKLQETLIQLHNGKCRLEHLVKQNVSLMEAKNLEVGRRSKLENVVTELNETMVVLREEEQRLVVNVAELEDKCVVNEEKQRVMRKKIDKLLEERKCHEKSIEGLMDEQIMLERKLHETLIELHNWKCKLEQLVKQNISLLDAKQRLCCDVGSFEKQVAELKIVILRLEESNKVRKSEVKSLESEVKSLGSKVLNYTCKLECVEAERSKLGNCLYEEKQNVEILKERTENMEMKLKESVKGAGKMKAEFGVLLVEKIDLENQSVSQKKEIASLKSVLDKAQNELSKMRGNVARAASESELVMNMLDRTLTCCLKGEGESKDGDLSGKETSCGEAKQCGKKFEMIKNAFEVKEAKVDSMRKKLEFLKKYVQEANKKNSVWEEFTFVIMLLAAVYLANFIRRCFF